MGNTVIKVENLSKQYRLGLVGASTFKEDASRWWAKMRGKEDPFLALGVENDRTSISESKFVWSLRDINFEVQQGDVLGIIGRNGAGKSTLLKILSKITSPTTGTVKAKGRIASLLEVGTGFHPELTGRENIFLNGAILGMRNHEIKSKLDEIIAFAGVERYIDTPVKRYSSGMYVRLAFAVAAHLENEILIIDEVLAVGDAEFQKKCLSKMGEVSSNEGRTVLFVSHNIQSVSNLCTRSILLDKGNVRIDSSVDVVLRDYHNMFKYTGLDLVSLKDRRKRTTQSAIFTEFVAKKNNLENWEFNYGENINFFFKIKVNDDLVNGISIFFSIEDSNSSVTITNFKTNLINNKCYKNQELHFNLNLPSKSIRPGQYGLYIAIFNNDFTVSYDVLDQNVNLPLLRINSVTSDIHYNLGFFDLDVKIFDLNK